MLEMLTEILARYGIEVRTRTVILGDSATLEGECRRLEAFADEPTWWLGHSLGGIVSLALARLAPRVVRGIVTLASTARADACQSAERRRLELAQAEEDGHPMSISLALKSTFDVERGTPLGRTLMRQAAHVGLARFRMQTRYALERADQRVQTFLTLPLLAISGALDAVCPPDRSDEVAQVSTQGAHICIEGAGHLLPITHAEVVAQHIATFINHHHGLHHAHID